MSVSMHADLLVVGAGPAGLAHAFWRHLDDDKLDVRLVDGEPEPGGWVKTRRTEGYVCEQGPQGIRPNAASDAFIAALGIGDQVVPADPAAKLRYLARDGRLHPLPAGPGELLKTGIFSLFGKVSLCFEPFRRRGANVEESLAAFVGRRFGQQAVPLAEAMASGVYGGDAHAIEMAAAFPGIADMEQKHGSLLRGMLARRKHRDQQPKRPPLCTFLGGMSAMVQALRQRLGSSMTLGREVVALARKEGTWHVHLGGEVPAKITADELVLAIPSRCAAPLLHDLDPELASELAAIPYASIANIFLGFQSCDAQDVLRGFGFLLDRREGSPMLGAIYCSALFPDSAMDGTFLVRVLAGGVLHPETVEQSEEELADRAETMLRSYTGLTGPLLFKRVTKARDAIPQYVAGHGSRLARIRARTERHEGLHLIGNSYDEVSVVGQLHRPASASARSESFSNR